MRHRCTKRRRIKTSADQAQERKRHRPSSRCVIAHNRKWSRQCGEAGARFDANPARRAARQGLGRNSGGDNIRRKREHHS